MGGGGVVVGLVVVFSACRKNVGMTMTCNRYEIFVRCRHYCITSLKLSKADRSVTKSCPLIFTL